MAEKFNPAEHDLKEQLISLNRVSKTVKGGRIARFAALMVVGDGAGHVGVGLGIDVAHLAAAEGDGFARRRGVGDGDSQHGAEAGAAAGRGVVARQREGLAPVAAAGVGEVTAQVARGPQVATAVVPRHGGVGVDTGEVGRRVDGDILGVTHAA